MYGRNNSNLSHLTHSQTIKLTNKIIPSPFTFSIGQCLMIHCMYFYYVNYDVILDLVVIPHLPEVNKSDLN